LFHYRVHRSERGTPRTCQFCRLCECSSVYFVCLPSSAARVQTAALFLMSGSWALPALQGCTFSPTTQVPYFGASGVPLFRASHRPQFSTFRYRLLECLVLTLDRCWDFVSLLLSSVTLKSILTYSSAVAWSLDDGKPCKAWIPCDYGWHVALYVCTLLVFNAHVASHLPHSSYDSCDVGTFPNQTNPDHLGPAAALHSNNSRPQYNYELSWLSGQRLS